MPSLAEKLNPTRFPGMSPFMAAVVGFVLGESFTDPEIAELMVSESENIVYIRKAGGIGFEGMQSLEDFRNNWNRLIDVAGLTPEERREAVQLFNQEAEKVTSTVSGELKVTQTIMLWCASPLVHPKLSVCPSIQYGGYPEADWTKSGIHGIASCRRLSGSHRYTDGKLQRIY